MKKIFGEINLSWKKIIISALVIGVLVGLLNSVIVLHNTSITDIAIYFDWWILFGIIIIMNSKSNKESALKCFVFFLISQPLIYLVEVPFSDMGWNLFTYYKYWFIWTVLCLPMGYLGYNLKKDKWWGLLILFPMLLIIGYDLEAYLDGMLFAFPRHLISYLFGVLSMIMYPIYIFNNKKIKITGLIISIILILIFSINGIINKPVYDTYIKCSSEELYFDNTYKVYLEDNKYGEVAIEYDSNLEEYCIHSKFIGEGKTKLILEKDDNKRIFDLMIKRNTYELEEEKNYE